MNYKYTVKRVKMLNLVHGSISTSKNVANVASEVRWKETEYWNACVP